MRALCITLTSFVIAAAFLSRTNYLIPNEWSHDEDTIPWVANHKFFFIVPACIYIPVVFGLQRWMKDRPAFDLGGYRSKAALNYVFWWELVLGLFSIVGTLICVPVALEPLVSGRLSMVELICKPSAINRADPRSFWGLLFIISKVPELGDTIFIVLRKKELVLLQWYHHLFTLVLVAYATLTMTPYNNIGLLFTGMNYFVHAFMYTWYAFTRTGWKSPHLFKMTLTFMQFAQMIAGLGFTYVAQSDRYEDCGRWGREAPWSTRLVYSMYASYAFLFGKLFYENYMHAAKRKSKKVE